MDVLVKNKVDLYPREAVSVLIQIRQAIYDIADEYQLGNVEETLKWGQPSYLVKGGSTVRFDWNPDFPERCFVFFHCQTKLVETFREVYGDQLEYQGKRAIVLRIKAPFPSVQLTHCLSLALRYHSLKQLPLLGC
ncbi:DUF1801 domain-containing protein [Marinomonas mediterranea]|uniref:YdhG-like domain-containing protein n=1 Tax=Marinomonas mediterranea (strain ATCC 700492 / JCM 21426 / NBRC 103028 / MMB-1) TaxID=717774 RepID=F2JUY1_MARM1|nr:DUF1801 domain-containing protein [Marinomonas mediterranea]ADZ91635.1 hypothetical protein Marme_2398 [Marinomonas mediterranea MMB-1]WCN17736.1 DUF1801 domain-containing protein [Marinomonas mediterranea MMB-1]